MDFFRSPLSRTTLNANALKSLVVVVLAMVFIAMLFIAGCSTPKRPTSNAKTAPQQSALPHPIIQAYYQAFNQNNVEALLSTVADDVAWISVAGESTSVELRGKVALRKWLENYFAQYQSIESTVQWLPSADGLYVGHECVVFLKISVPKAGQANQANQDNQDNQDKINQNESSTDSRSCAHLSIQLHNQKIQLVSYLIGAGDGS